MPLLVLLLVLLLDPQLHRECHVHYQRGQRACHRCVVTTSQLRCRRPVVVPRNRPLCTDVVQHRRDHCVRPTVGRPPWAGGPLLMTMRIFKFQVMALHSLQQRQLFRVLLMSRL